MLCRLGYLLGETRYLDAAERTLRAAWPALQQYPQAHMSLVNALEDFLGPLQIVIIRGDAAQLEHWAAALSALYAPTRLIFAIPRDAAELPAGAGREARRCPTPWPICARGMTCSAPIADVREIVRELE